jgi:hypothetical protein
MPTLVCLQVFNMRMNILFAKQICERLNTETNYTQQQHLHLENHNGGYPGTPHFPSPQPEPQP